MKLCLYLLFPEDGGSLFAHCAGRFRLLFIQNLNLQLYFALN